MPATSILDRDMTFTNMPVKRTKRGFAIPYPAILRISKITGNEDSHDKEWDARSASFPHLAIKTYCLASMDCKPIGKAGFTKTITSAREVTLAEWNTARLDWAQWLTDNAEDYTNTHKTVLANLRVLNNRLISRRTSSVPTVTAPAPLPTVAPTLVISNNAVTMDWDPLDPDIADDLYDVPQDDPTFLPDPETDNIISALWNQAVTSNEPRTLLIMGHTSTGKTRTPIIWAARNDVLHCRIDCGAFGEIYDVTGPIKAKEANGVSITEWVKGKTIRAMADPRPAIIQLDEVNRISDVKAVNVLLPFLDDSRQSYFDDAQAWMKMNGVKLVIATMNGDTRGDDIGEYVGTQPLDQAFISRFPNRRQLRYPTPEKLALILEARNQGFVRPETITTLAEIATELVALNKFVPNLRELFAALDFLKQGHDMYRALKWTVGGVYQDDGTAGCDFTSFKAVLIGKNINTDETP